MGGGKTFAVNTQAEWEAKHAEAKADGKLVVVDFWAEWCGPCKMIADVYAQLSEQYPNVLFLKVDVDTAQPGMDGSLKFSTPHLPLQALATMCGIGAMPTFQVYSNGEKVDELVGAAKDKLEAMLKKHVEEGK